MKFLFKKNFNIIQVLLFAGLQFYAGYLMGSGKQGSILTLLVYIFLYVLSSSDKVRRFFTGLPTQDIEENHE